MFLFSKYKLYYLIPIVFNAIILLSTSPIENISLDSKFDKYWYQGKAEITSYDLVQARYGELHEGSAVLIFVTEPFSKSKQVKLNTTERNKMDAVQVLKTNFSKKFATGIYDYSILQSVFTPVDIDKYAHTLKVTTSVQEWCGHTFTQLNLQTYKYKIVLNSYFEQAMLEDEIWNLIRIAPEALPVGEIQLIPSIATARLRHTDLDVEEAEASLTEHETDKSLMTYQLTFLTSQRKMAIHYHKKFPYEIEGWTETYIDGGKELTTTATRKKTMLSDYWNKNNKANLPLRKELGLK